MAVANSVTSVGTTRVALTIPPNGWVANNGGKPVFLGGSTVTADSSSTGGLVLKPGDKIGPFVTGGTLNAIVASEYDESPTAQVAILSGLA
jgi:hypothetical protein